MRISKEVIEKIKDDKTIKANLCVAFDKHFGTIERWINMNIENGPLTTASSVSLIKSSYKLSEKEILVREPAVA